MHNITRNMVTKLWNHTDRCTSGELNECNCGLPDVLELMRCRDCESKNTLLRDVLLALKEMKEVLK